MVDPSGQGMKASIVERRKDAQRKLTGLLWFTF